MSLAGWGILEDFGIHRRKSNLLVFRKVNGSLAVLVRNRR
jgi:hypothetical protein